MYLDGSPTLLSRQQNGGSLLIQTIVKSRYDVSPPDDHLTIKISPLYVYRYVATNFVNGQGTRN